MGLSQEQFDFIKMEEDKRPRVVLNMSQNTAAEVLHRFKGPPGIKTRFGNELKNTGSMFSAQVMAEQTKSNRTGTIPGTA